MENYPHCYSKAPSLQEQRNKEPDSHGRVVNVIRRWNWQWKCHKWRRATIELVATQCRGTHSLKMAGHSKSTRCRTMDKECGSLKRSWKELKHISGNPEWWYVGVVSTLFSTKGVNDNHVFYTGGWKMGLSCWEGICFTVKNKKRVFSLELYTTIF